MSHKRHWTTPCITGSVVGVEAPKIIIAPHVEGELPKLGEHYRDLGVALVAVGFMSRLLAAARAVQRRWVTRNL
jgi:hypothetical protein